MADIVLEGIVEGEPEYLIDTKVSESKVAVPFRFLRAYYTSYVQHCNIVLGLTDLNRGSPEVEFTVPFLRYPRLEKGMPLRIEISKRNGTYFTEAIRFSNSQEGHVGEIIFYY